MKLLVIGHARHGKDTASDILCELLGLQYVSSSYFMASRVVFPYFEKTHPGFYSSLDECFEDRHNHRALWYNLINAYNYCPHFDMTRLGRAIFAEHDIYCGLRNSREFWPLKNEGVFDVSVWIDRSHLIEAEPKDSMTLEPWMADFVVDNNGTQKELRHNLEKLVEHHLKGTHHARL